ASCGPGPCAWESPRSACYCRNLPVTIERLESIDALRMLAAAGFVKATIPPPAPNPATGRIEQPPAVVTALTPAGRKWCAQMNQAGGLTAPARVQTGLDPEEAPPPSPPRGANTCKRLPSLSAGATTSAIDGRDGAPSTRSSCAAN